MATVKDRIEWSLTRDDDGHRTYKIKWLVEAASPNEGPASIANATGLPAIGSTWAFASDVDAWAFCWPNLKVAPVLTKEKSGYWTVENTFTTKPLNRCQDTAIENPLNEPDRISGSFVKYTREATEDKDGNPIVNSAHEQYRGAAVEIDMNRPTVTIEKNLSSRPLSTFAPMIDTLNDATLWGLPTQCIKLSNVSWTRNLYGTCTYYYTVSYEFDVRYDTFDKQILDEGTMVLAEGGNVNNPEDFIKYKDLNGENSRVILDGAGQPWDGTGSPYYHDVKFYSVSNFLSLGIPSSL